MPKNFDDAHLVVSLLERQDADMPSAEELEKLQPADATQVRTLIQAVSRRTQKEKKINAICRSAAILILTLLFGTIVTVTPVHAVLMDFITELFGGYLTFGGGIGESNYQDDYEGAYQAGWMPEGFRLKEVQGGEGSDCTVLTYKSDDRIIIVSVYENRNLSLTEDIENAEIAGEKYWLERQKAQAILIEKGDLVTVIWGSARYFKVEGYNVSLEDVIRVADNLQISSNTMKKEE